MSGLPMTHGLRVFDVLEPNFTPSSLSCAWNWPPKLGSEGCVYFLKKLHYASAWKSGIGFPLVRHRYNSCDLGKNAMLSAQLYTLCFQALWSSGSENYIVRNLQSKSIRLQSKSNITFKIRFWVFTHGMWRAGSSEHRVIPSKLMKRGWKYPLKHQEGDEGTPLKDIKLGALYEYLLGETKLM